MNNSDPSLGARPLAAPVRVILWLLAIVFVLAGLGLLGGGVMLAACGCRLAVPVSRRTVVTM